MNLPQFNVDIFLLLKHRPGDAVPSLAYSSRCGGRPFNDPAGCRFPMAEDHEGRLIFMNVRSSSGSPFVQMQLRKCFVLCYSLLFAAIQVICVFSFSALRKTDISVKWAVNRYGQFHCTDNHREKTGTKHFFFFYKEFSLNKDVKKHTSVSLSVFLWKNTRVTV